MERERRDREERERRDRERADKMERERRERQAREEVNRHFQMSMELAQKVLYLHCYLYLPITFKARINCVAKKWLRFFSPRLDALPPSPPPFLLKVLYCVLLSFLAA
jgi:hypothetical protein